MSHMSIDAFRSIVGGKIRPKDGGLMWNDGRDMEVLVGLISMFRPKNFLEIGVFEGRTSKSILESCPFIERYVGVDFRYPFSERVRLDWPDPDNQCGFAALGDIRFHMNFTDDDGKWMVQDVGPIDMVLIDGNHDYEPVKRDSEMARESLRNGNGVIVWHDYTNDGTCRDVTRYILDNNQDNRKCHVVDSFICFEVIGKSPLGGIV